MIGFVAALAILGRASFAEAPAPQRIVLSTQVGSVDLYLPKHIAPGETVAGSAFATPIGEDWKSQHEEIRWLESLVVRIGNDRFPVGKTFVDFRAPQDTAAVSIDIEDVAGKVYSSFSLPIDAAETAPGASWAKVVKAGDPIQIEGRFDGNREQTFATIDGREVGVLAEGETACYVTAPVDARGPIRVRVREGDTVVNQKVNVVGFTFMAPAKAVVVGKPSSIGVEVDGLQDADPSVFPVTVELTIDNPVVMYFDGPNAEHCLLQIMPKDVVDGHFVASVPIRAGDVGRYRLTGTVYSAGRS